MISKIQWSQTNTTKKLNDFISETRSSEHDWRPRPQTRLNRSAMCLYRFLHISILLQHSRCAARIMHNDSWFCSNLTDTPNPKNKMRPCKHSCPWNAARVSRPSAGPRRWAFSLRAAGLPHVCDFLFIHVFSKCAWPSEPPYRSDSLQSIIPVSRLQAGVFALNVSLWFIFWQQESLCSVSVPSGRWMRLNVFFICPPRHARHDGRRYGVEGR